MAEYLKRWRKLHAETMVYAMCSSESETENDATIASVVATNTPKDLPCSASDSDFEVPLQYISSSAESDHDNYHAETQQEHRESLDKLLANWSARHCVTRSAMNDLLEILRAEGHSLPKDARTLMKTPRSIDSIEKCAGEYVYFGMENGIKRILSQSSLEGDTIHLMVNIDGLPLYRSSSIQLWPILCSVSTSAPFIAALYCGTTKPSCVNSYLEDFLREYEQLSANGLVCSGKVFKVELKAFICDAPARSMLKGIKGHTSLNACERCIVVGQKKENRTVFLSGEVSNARTDQAFAAFSYTAHQVVRSPLPNYGLSCVKGFSLDYMHSVCLGVVRRMLFFWKAGPRCCRLSHAQQKALSEQLCELRGRLPSEFSRQPRSFFEIERWKATEFRSFLLYTGPVILRKILSKAAYETFMALSIGISIMLDANGERRKSYLSYAKDLLQFFVRSSRTIFGDIFVVFNVHNLLHLHEDIEHFGTSLDVISAFRFENYLQKIKQLVRHGQNPLVQVAKRLYESSGMGTVSRKKSSEPKNLQDRDSWFLLKCGRVAQVTRHGADGYLCKVISERRSENFFTSPCESKLLNIRFVLERHMQTLLLEELEIHRKLICFGLSDGYVLFPLLHDPENY